MRVLLGQFGVANDAQDHGAGDEGVQLRRDATAGLAELLREHPFLTELYPSLAAELGSWRLEALSWSAYVDDVERRLRYVHVERIPWDRVVHFRGRATDVPEWITELGKDSHAEAEERLTACLVRDGRIGQAAPLALRLILGGVRFGLHKDAGAVGRILEHIRSAARVVLEARSRKGTSAQRVDWSLYREDRLWPPFESEARDAELWAAWRPNDEDALGWALLIQGLFEEHDRLSARR